MGRGQAFSPGAEGLCHLRHERRANTWFGRIGYTAKGVAFGIVGALVGYAALTHEPRKSGGLDQALREVLEQPLGPLLLLAIATGIGCYGLFCFAWARHLLR